MTKKRRSCIEMAWRTYCDLPHSANKLWSHHRYLMDTDFVMCVSSFLTLLKVCACLGEVMKRITKNAHTQTSGLSPVWAAGSFSLLHKDRYLYLQGLCNGYKIQRNGLGMSNSRNLQGVTQMDLVKDEMGQQGRGLWEPHRTSLAFLQRFHQTESRFTLHAHTHGLIYQSFSKVVCKCFHRTNQKKILPDL